MKHYQYLIIGGGMAADAAVNGIREVDANSSIGLLGDEPVTPYKRPPLSKGLWNGKPLERIWYKTADRGVDMSLNCHAVALDPRGKRVTAEDGSVYEYEKLLIATGGRPRRLPFGQDEVLYYRTVGDYGRLRELAERKERFAVIGGGFIGSELAAALAMQGKQVTLVLRGETINGNLFPADIAEFLNNLYRDKGVTLATRQAVTGVDRRGDELSLYTRGADDRMSREWQGDGIVAGIGIELNVELARSAGLYIQDGIWVDEFLRTSHPDIYAAGDVAWFHNPLLGKRLRVEHENNAEVMGQTAGRNMAGGWQPYHHLPYFYSDLFDVGYEAVGELEPGAEKVVDWKRPYQEGVIYYLRGGRVRGVVCWNIFGKMEEARKLIAGPHIDNPQELIGRI